MLGINISELNYRRLQNFKNNKRGYRSFKIFIFLFLFTLFAEFLANDKPLLIKYKDSFYFPTFQNYTEKTFDGDFETYTDYKDRYIKTNIEKNGWMLWPLIAYSHDTINYLIPTINTKPIIIKVKGYFYTRVTRLRLTLAYTYTRRQQHEHE